MGSKLIRDKIPEIMEREGRTGATHIATTEEYYEKLKMKLKEEVAEFSKDEKMEELADILEVVYSIAKFKQLSIEELEKIRKEKVEKRGSFDKRIILDTIVGT
jgi:predicted house-cleaning noncanonical NTP pyrophosphatase (MazG superfamily)